MSRTKVSGKKKAQHNIFYDFQNYLANGLSLLVSIYMLLVIVVMPFYFTDGYTRIGTNKYEFFYGISTKLGLIFVPLVCIYMVLSFYIHYKVEKREEGIFQSFSLTDKFACGYGVVVLLSYFFSEYREKTSYGDAWKGTSGWYMGACSQLIFVIIYFSVSRLWKKNKWIPALWFPVTFVVFLLGILNRFEIRPLEMENATVYFISTVGNINWYCGYMVIVLFGVLYYIWACEEKKTWIRVLMLVWMIVAFMALMTQGSLSGILAMGVVLVTLYLLSMKDGKKLSSFAQCVGCLGLACTITYGLRLLFPEHYILEDALIDLFTYSPLALVILGAGVLGYLLITLLQKKGKFSARVFTWIGKLGCVVMAIAVVAYIILAAYSTANADKATGLLSHSIFKLDYNWGSMRGASIAAAIMTFADQDVWSKLIGIGPDTMAMYVHSGNNPELLEVVTEYFPNLVLTNSHNEWLTMLVNVGILGMIAYAGMMVSAICRFLKNGKNSLIVGACGLAVLAYTINNMVSFQQAMATTTVFVVLGIGEAYMRALPKDK